MIRSILLPLAEAPANMNAKNCAFWLAKKDGSCIHALAVIDVALFEVPVLGTPEGFMPSVVAPSLQEGKSLLNDLTTLSKERLDQFAKQCASRNIPCSTETKTGIPAEVIGRTALAHDIVVISRSGYSRSLNSKQTVDPLVSQIIRHSIRPVMVAGADFQEGGEVHNILVAYDGSIHAGRSLWIAAELGSRPGVTCTLATVAHSEELGQEILAPADEYLCHHNVTPKKHVVIHSKPSEVICGLVGSAGADIVIMGAYGHSPIREVLFGSTTERVLSHCAATVILQF
jgi:nucleotide-binding universal stress UspA family protein